MTRAWSLCVRAVLIPWLVLSGARLAPGADPPAGNSDRTTISAARSHPLGFSPGTRDRQLEAEAKALAVPTPESARNWLRTLTAEPHVAGTPADYKTAIFVRDKLREWGWKADLQELEVLLNYPVGPPRLNLRRPTFSNVSLDEAAVSTDKDSANSAAFGAFNGYGPSGEAVGQVVYANYGRPEDFTALEKLGVDLKGKIVLVRYGELFRGLKVRNAQKRGAAGLLIFSDPADDGYAKGDIYPAGPFRPGSAIQRGSVQFLSLGPGDPSTPFGPSTKGAKRIPFSPAFGFAVGEHANSDSATWSQKKWESETGLSRVDYFATIPSLPLSYDAAHELLKLLAGPTVPTGWQGGLPLAYHMGPGPAEAEMVVTMDYQLRTIWNVIATIPGTVEPERWIMVGNHRDAWVYGAVDPGSGTAATLEMCRALGAAVKNGWKPRRTLLYASWDAEEYGLVGSTEWAEEHASLIDEKAVLMLNVDSAVSGHELGASGVPSLRELMLDAADAIIEPRTGKTFKSVWIEARRAAWAKSAPLVLYDPLWDGAAAKYDHRRDSTIKGSRAFAPQLGWLGSGSDFTAFVDHLGVPAIDIGFRGSYGVYHSIYDDFNWMEKHGDPEFITHATAARLYTILVMRAAAADVVPLKFVPYGQALREHVDEIRLLEAQKERKSAGDAAAAGREFDGLASLVDAVKAFQIRAEELDRSTEAVADADGHKPELVTALNDALARVERAFLLEKGLPGRAWFKHAIYAPGLTTGYASWPLPAIRQDIEEPNKARLAADVALTVERVKSATSALEAALERASATLKSR
jgi:N-acetylated-alpha-linked acidic dipeptidase